LANYKDMFRQRLHIDMGRSLPDGLYNANIQKIFNEAARTPFLPP
jgi:hypothetical protein